MSLEFIHIPDRRRYEVRLPASSVIQSSTVKVKESSRTIPRIVPQPDLFHGPRDQPIKANMNPVEDDLVYEARAKLYRFHPEIKDWKEAGIGKLKLVQNKANWQRFRVLMWREAVLKVACNHLITKTMVIDYFQQSDTNLSWKAMDFTETDGKYVKFAAKFGKPSRCNTFKNYFEQAVAIMKLDENAAPVRLQPEPESEPEQQPPVNAYKLTFGPSESLPLNDSSTIITPVGPPIELK